MKVTHTELAEACARLPDPETHPFDVARVDLPSLVNIDMLSAPQPERRRLCFRKDWMTNRSRRWVVWTLEIEA